MDTESLKLFMDVVQTGNITNAANNSFITQSAASKRLWQLEKELGVSLFQRGKGKPQIELTQAGEAFFDIAERMLLLYGQSLELNKNENNRVLTIACINSAQDYALPPFLAKFQRDFPEIHYSLENHHSPEIISLLINRRIDIGILQGEVSNLNLRSVLLYEERYRVVMRQSSQAPPKGSHLRTQDLKVGNEIYEDFGNTYKQWHDAHWKSSIAKIRVNTTPTAIQYLQDPMDWLLVPETVAWVLESEGFLSYALIEETPLHPVFAVCPKKTHDEYIIRFMDEAQQFYCTQKLWDWIECPMQQTEPR